MEDSSGLRAAARTDATLLGSWQVVPHPAVAELVASLGYDFVGIDVEHSPTADETLADLLRTVDAALAAARDADVAVGTFATSEAERERRLGRRLPRRRDGPGTPRGECGGCARPRPGGQPRRVARVTAGRGRRRRRS